MSEDKPGLHKFFEPEGSPEEGKTDAPAEETTKEEERMKQDKAIADAIRWCDKHKASIDHSRNDTTGELDAKVIVRIHNETSIVGTAENIPAAVSAVQKTVEEYEHAHLLLKDAVLFIGQETGISVTHMDILLAEVRRHTGKDIKWDKK